MRFILRTSTTCLQDFSPSNSGATNPCVPSTADTSFQAADDHKIRQFLVSRGI